ncbi:hypothetical protein Droror1_Dr00000053 [Drosera rotundifolia]
MKLRGGISLGRDLTTSRGYCTGGDNSLKRDAGGLLPSLESSRSSFEDAAAVGLGLEDGGEKQARRFWRERMWEVLRVELADSALFRKEKLGRDLAVAARSFFQAVDEELLLCRYTTREDLAKLWSSPAHSVTELNVVVRCR